jgi:MATE family multidrug resistance protein
MSLLPGRARFREMLVLALPIAAVQLGLMAMGVVDTVMVGHLSAEALAAVALGTVYFFAVAIFGMGTLLALDPIAAQAVGAGDREAVAHAIQRGLLLAAALCVPVCLLLIPASPVLLALHQPPGLVAIAGPFCLVSAAGVPGFLGFVVLRQGLQAEGRTRGILLTVLVANLANIGLNWVLIFGHLGAPPLGPIGSAWATVASRTLLPLLLLVFEWPHLRTQLFPRRPGLLAWGPLLQMLRLGVPIGFQHQLEYGVFGVVGLLMDTLGAAEMAGHQIALNLASLTFMVPLGIASAAAVLVGQAAGAGDRERAGQSAGAALILAIVFMSSTAAVFLLAPGWLANLYTNDSRAAAVAVLLIPLAGIFQVFDGLQVVSIGALRGLADTRTPMVANVLGFWVVGLPTGLWLAFRVGLGAVGLWWGLVIGLVAVGLTLVARLAWRLGQPLERVGTGSHLSPPSYSQEPGSPP